MNLCGDCRTVSDSPPASNLGFLSVVHESSGYLGGYLLTNGWGRPLEFRLTSAVQPNRVQAALYGDTLIEYVHGELIGKTLIEKSSTTPALVVTDVPMALVTRNFVSMPVIAVLPDTDQPPPFGTLTFRHARCRGSILLSEKHAADQSRIEQQLAHIDSSVDLLEPFLRIREAMAEARKMGVMSRAA
jgi:hypothetical protein